MDDDDNDYGSERKELGKVEGKEREREMIGKRSCVIKNSINSRRNGQDDDSSMNEINA